MKDNKTTNPETQNPFTFSGTLQDTTETRKLDYTPVLISTSNQRAQDLMVNVGKKPELFDLANRAIDNGVAQDLIDLIKAVYNDDQIKTDAAILDGCDETQLGKLLESRRSDRSKAKKKNPRSNVQVCKTYISSMYAELLIRSYWNKPYTGQVGATELNIEALKDDQEALSRKVKSLQSKKSRLNKIAQYDENARKELEEVKDEIARLNALRPTVRTTPSKTVVKDLDVDRLREVLKGIDPATLPKEEQDKFLTLMTKLG